MIIIKACQNSIRRRVETGDIISGITRIAVRLGAILLFAVLVASPSSAAEAAARSLEICATRLIPSLFLFIALTGIITSTRIAEFIGRLLRRPFAYLFGIATEGACAFLLGSVGGFPIGAVTARRLYDDRLLSRDEAARLITFSSNAGMAFCVGGIGVSLYGSAAVGWQIYLCSLVSAIIIGIVQNRGTSSRNLKSQNVKTHTSHILPASPNAPLAPQTARQLLSAVSDSIAAAGLTMLKICAFAVFFGVVGELSASALTALAARLGYSGDKLSAGFACLCELTLASRLCAELGPALSIPLCTFAAGFAGMSVHMQTAAAVGDAIPLRRYFIAKTAQGLLAASLSLLCCHIARTL